MVCEDSNRRGTGGPAMVDSAGARLKERGWNRGCEQAEAAVPRDQKERLGSQLSLLTSFMWDQGKQVNLADHL